MTRVSGVPRTNKGSGHSHLRYERGLPQGRPLRLGRLEVGVLPRRQVRPAREALLDAAEEAGGGVYGRRRDHADRADRLVGLSGSSFAGFTGPSGISRSNSKRRSSMTTETAASRSANWSPTHLRSPAPKGIMAWSDAISRFATHSPPSGFILPVLGSKPNA